MTDREMVIEFASDIPHAGYLDDCKLIGEALAYKGRIPRAFWQNLRRFSYLRIKEREWDKYHDKSSMRKLRDMAAEAIIESIRGGIADPGTAFQEPMRSDHYFRLLSALTWLGIPKTDTRIPKDEFGSSNEMYRVAYNLWLLDDGSNDWDRLHCIAKAAAAALGL